MTTTEGQPFYRQDACGVVTCGRGGRFYQCKANGMVRDVLNESSLSHLIGSMGVGHGARAQAPLVSNPR